MIASDASLRLSTTVRCCPCEPYTRTSLPSSTSATSSRCGPTDVLPRSTSRAALSNSRSRMAAASRAGSASGRFGW